MTTKNPKAPSPKRKGKTTPTSTKPEATPEPKTASTSAGSLQAMSEGYIKNLEAVGKSHGTLFSYGMELKLALKALGAETPVTALTVAEVEAFFGSDVVTKTRTGKPKAKPTIDKTRRVLRLALDWAAAEGWIAEAPLPRPAAKEAKA